MNAAADERAARPVVRVLLLGPFEIRLPSGRVAGPWTRPTARRLLQLLLLSRGYRLGREEVIEHLFPELAPERAANALSKALSMARRALADAETGIEIVRADRSSVWIDGDVDLHVDLETHERSLQAALAMSPGSDRDDALERALQPDGRLLDDELYADWAISRRDHLDRLRSDARLALARDRSAGIGHSDTASVLDAWSGVLAADATSEEAAIFMMRALAEHGRRDEAVRTYHRCRAALRRHLDTEPSPALEAALVEAQRTPVTVQPPTPMRAVPTFGRDAVLQQIDAHLERTLSGDGPSLAILGPAGIGKSHVLSAVRSRLIGEGWLVLHATSIPADAVVPYAALRTALTPLAAEVREGGLLARVMGHRSTAEPAQNRDAAEQQMALAGEIAQLLDEAGRDRPVALVLDDCHWMEPGLAAVTARLASRSGHRRWALLTAARTDEPDAPVAPPASNVIRIDLNPLSPAPLTEVVRDRLAAQADLLGDEIERIVTRSGGNPLFAVELARAHLLSPLTATGSVPEQIGTLFKRRLAAGTREGRALIPVVALAGDTASFELLLDVGTRVLESEPGAIEAIDDLLSRGLLIEDPAGVRLVHPLLRDTALASLNPIRRAALHDALATSIEAIGGDGADIDAATHRIAAFTTARLRRYALAAVRDGSTAAEAAFEVFAEGPALDLYRGVVAAFDALPAADRATWRRRALSAWLRVASIQVSRYEVADAEHALNEALALADADEERSAAWRGLAGIPYRKGDFAGAVSVLERGVASLGDGSDQLRAEMAVSIAWSLLRDGRTGEAADRLRAALPVLREAGPESSVFLCLDYLALALEAEGRHDEAADAWARAEESLDRATELEPDPSSRGVRRSRATFTLHHGLRPLLMGDTATAVRDLEAALQTYLPVGDRYEISVVQAILASAHQLAGDLGASLEAWDASARLLEGSGNWYHLAGVHAARASALEALGRSEEGLAAADLARRIARDDAHPQTIDEVEDIISGRTIFLSFNRRGLKPRPTA